MPEKVRCVAVPPKVMPVPEPAAIVPSSTESVTDSSASSGSANGVPVYCRGVATSSVTPRLDGALTVGGWAATAV